MQRRDFVGAMLALFCGVAAPKPVRESIIVAERPEPMWVALPPSSGVRWPDYGAYIPEPQPTSSLVMATHREVARLQHPRLPGRERRRLIQTIRSRPLMLFEVMPEHYKPEQGAFMRYAESVI